MTVAQLGSRAHATWEPSGAQRLRLQLLFYIPLHDTVRNLGLQMHIGLIDEP